MNADRSQPGNQRPREAPQSSGGFDDAPTAVQSEPAPSTPVASRDLLFVRFALHNGFINQETLDNALAEQQADASRSLAEILVKSGSISENERGAIEHLCREHVVRHGGDPQQSLDTLSMPPTVSYRQPPGTDTVTFSQRPTDGKQPQGTFGDYELLREIARGGMGRILAAHDRTLDREVALKILLPGANADRFVRESKITARLPHPGIPPVHALGTLADGSPFLAMKLIVGKTLADELKTADRPRLLQAFTQVCQAVGFAQSRGVIHRDLKPANIMVGAFGEVQVMDWGLAKELGISDCGLRIDEGSANLESEETQAGTVLGTPSYMAPEQARGEATDARGDVFALGGILCAILTGHPPFTGKSSLEVIQRAASADLAEANAKLDGCGADAELVALCQRCLSPDPVDRPADGQAVADALTAYVNGVQERLQAAERERAVTLAKATEQRKRRRVVAALSAVVVIIMAVGSLAAVEMRNAARAKGLVDSLVSADVAQLPQILTELENQRGRVTPMLVALAGAEPKTADERKVQLHARLALVTHDERQVLPLVEELLTANVSYVGVTRDQLAPYQQHFQGDLWELLHDATKPPARRFRAGLALAGYATNSEQWTPADDAFLVEQLVAANPDHQPQIRKYLRSLNNRLLRGLERIFADPRATESQQLGTANALADFRGNDTPLLAHLLSAATPGQYEILYPLVAEASDAAGRESLNQLVRETPAAGLPPIERVALGRRRAGAAITLLRHGERESILNVLRIHDDPESLTQFVHRCRQRGILPAQLLECLKLVDQLRQSKSGEARRIEDRALYALLLALGEFEFPDLPEAQRDAFVEQLANWYADDPSSAIHGAAGWLLRHWKHDELAKKVDDTAVPYALDREWFTLKLLVPPSSGDSEVGDNSTSQSLAPPGTTEPVEGATTNDAGPAEGGATFYSTFVVFPAGEYLMGSAPDETNRQGDEPRHLVKLTRPIAVGDREITWEQIHSFDLAIKFNRHDAWEEQYERTLTPADPAFGVSWYEAVAYCRWLTECAGMAEDDQAYGDPTLLDGKRFPADTDSGADGAPRNWPVNLEKRGFRLPTEAEWEMVCRDGTNTSYSFGNDARLLVRYGWFLENSGKRSHAVGRLRPNLRGLFDIHGNLYEWCHDWYGEYVDEGPSGDPTGPGEGWFRSYRGGAWNDDATDCRSANRERDRASRRPLIVGFRVVAVPFSQASEPGDQAASDAGSGSRAADRPAAELSAKQADATGGTHE